jgi:organic hydroperoxide reductase OsmC/OhrA
MSNSAIRSSPVSKNADRIPNCFSPALMLRVTTVLCSTRRSGWTRPLEGSKVRALVSLIEDDQGGYRLGVELHAQLPGVDPAQALRVMEAAHVTCPYSKALRGDTAVTLVLD